MLTFLRFPPWVRVLAWQPAGNWESCQDQYPPGSWNWVPAKQGEIQIEIEIWIRRGWEENGVFLFPGKKEEVAGSRSVLQHYLMFWCIGDPDSRAIGDKIEQALDLVKTHLVYAVREEVDLLKDQIQELLEKNGRLQRENHLLKNLASPEQLQNLESCQPLQVRPPCPEDLRARKMKVHQDLEILLPGPSRKPNSHLRSGSSSLNAEPGIPPT
ncbi:uncharacterized protein LOC128406714 isoform X1 [Podarcis raffonei]|uniref:uncharacterized protein LOC128406714 isoform X1 n=1 Tax=Podarcis raffonei TaxID=65483 RepID=UPI0023292C2B|nr:uncharacterized protein LOC128406714 isoform X1 [Podarcis raffonei]